MSVDLFNFVEVMTDIYMYIQFFLCGTSIIILLTTKPVMSIMTTIATGKCIKLMDMAH